MNFITIITMLIVLGTVWGGMIFFLTRAVKYEKIKEENGEVEN